MARKTGLLSLFAFDCFFDFTSPPGKPWSSGSEVGEVPRVKIDKLAVLTGKAICNMRPDLGFNIANRFKTHRTQTMVELIESPYSLYCSVWAKTAAGTKITRVIDKPAFANGLQPLHQLGFVGSKPVCEQVIGRMIEGKRRNGSCHNASTQKLPAEVSCALLAEGEKPGGSCCSV